MKNRSVKMTVVKLLIISCILSIFTAPGGSMKEMTFDEFRNFMKTEGDGEFEVVFDGIEVASPVTSHKYLFLQIVTFCGESDIKSSYRTWNSDAEFVMVYKNINVSLSPRKVRTFIKETGSFEEKDSDDGRVLPSVEYGLMRSKKYYAKFASEEYHLPPDRESGKPRKKTNHVLWISGEHFQNGKPQVELTPMYKGWSY